jgi:HD-like signal output (HDOD) protein
VSRACELRQLLFEAGLADTVCRLGKLPSLPRLYQAITEEMNREDVSLKRVSGIIGKDVAMTAKVLQLVNSAFFGLGRRVGSIEQAVSYLGIDVIRSLVVSQSAFSSFESSDLGFYNTLWQHSTMTGMLAKVIAESGSDDSILHGEALQAGMLHDIGALILAARMPDKYREVLKIAQSGAGQLAMREEEAFGCDHGRVGAYLMGLWGLSDRIVEAIAFHDYPSKCSYRQFSPLTAVHAASALVLEAIGQPDLEGPLDLEYLAAVGCSDKIPEWREAAQRIVMNSGEENE